MSKTQRTVIRIDLTERFIRVDQSSKERGGVPSVPHLLQVVMMIRWRKRNPKA